MSVRESEFIAAITAGMAGRLPVGPGDDAAQLPDGTLVAVDAVVEGVHFVPGTAPERIARKALGRPLSDLCAMGGVGEVVFVAALVPPGLSALELAQALNAWARRFGVILGGGDTKRAPEGALALAVTAVGRCAGPPWLRSGGRPGDRLYVSGPLGGAAAGRHLDVTPRADVVAALRSAGTEVHACIDLSDGLGRNLALLCEASRVGACVEASAVPVHADVEPGRDRLLAALGDGEDYELLLALPEQARAPAGLVPIGVLTAERTLTLRRREGLEPWPAVGYEHAF